ncbi:glycoside hydrolase family 73 protein [Latilactobacillus sakei]|uniref:glycoside hydrolase family 73 protein n=1 Tax=Latilactobacillus sakei TaxID=1599 RepID=UPI00138A54AD|nr:glucosaminidase domain-containing protein [Latilactobacillus sakei]
MGRSDLATKANNLFGVKGQYQGQQILMNTDEYENNQRTTIKDYFKVYPSLEIAIQDHSNFLSVGTYATLTNLTNYAEQADLLQKAGYATDPNYATKIKKAIQDYDLAEYDA